jgi:hypothetical protein
MQTPLDAFVALLEVMRLGQTLPCKKTFELSKQLEEFCHGCAYEGNMQLTPTVPFGQPRPATWMNAFGLSGMLIYLLRIGSIQLCTWKAFEACSLFFIA